MGRRFSSSQNKMLWTVQLHSHLLPLWPTSLHYVKGMPSHRLWLILMCQGSMPGTKVGRSGAISDRGMRLSVIQGFLKFHPLAEFTLSAPGKVNLTTCASSFMTSKDHEMLMISWEYLVPFVKLLWGLPDKRTDGWWQSPQDDIRGGWQLTFAMCFKITLQWSLQHPNQQMHYSCGCCIVTVWLRTSSIHISRNCPTMAFRSQITCTTNASAKSKQGLHHEWSKTWHVRTASARHKRTSPNASGIFQTG